MSRFPTAGAAVLCAFLAAAFFYLTLQTPSAADSRAMVLETHPVPLIAETDNGAKRFSIEVADDDRERSAGLMFRESMDDSHGMLFVFEEARQVGFWMKNTPMALDLVFIGEDGIVRAVMRGEPFSEASISPPAKVRFVLELKAGIAQKSGIAEGDRIRHPEIDAVAEAG